MIPSLPDPVPSSSAPDSSVKGFYILLFIYSIINLVATGLQHSDVSGLKRGGITKTRTVVPVVTQAGTSQGTVAVANPVQSAGTSSLPKASVTNDSDSDDVICLGDGPPRNPRLPMDKCIKSEPMEKAEGEIIIS